MLKPIEDKIIVKVDEEENVSSSGLFLAPTGEKQGTATVIAVGPGITLNNGQIVVPEVSVGDKVAFAKYQGTEVEHDGETLTILTYRDILAVILSIAAPIAIISASKMASRVVFARAIRL